MTRALVLLLTFTACLGPPVDDGSDASTSALTNDTFYVDAVLGKDTFDGRTPSTPWKSLQRVSQSYFPAGARVLFKRGQEFRGSLTLRGSGDGSRPIVYGAYGDGPPPILLGSESRSSAQDWANVGTSLWRSTRAFGLEVGNIAFGGASATGPLLMGVRRFSLAELRSQGDFFFDTSTGHVTIFAATNPATVASRVECGLHYSLAQVTAEGQTGVTLENLALRYAGGYAIKVRESRHVTLRNLDIGWAGGATKVGTMTRLGNGIEFWASVSDGLVENCRIHDIYDSGISLQNMTTAATQQRITIRNNLIWNCGLASFELWLRPAGSVIRDVTIEHNTCHAVGGGWGGAQRPDQIGSHIVSFWNEAQAERISLRRNVFSEAKTASILFERRPGVVGHELLWNALQLDENLYFDSSPDALQLVTIDGTPSHAVVRLSDFSQYQQQSGKDLRSGVANPAFVDAAAGNFRLQPGSAARDRFTSSLSSRASDHYGAAVPQNGRIDVGAIEQ